MAKETTKEAKKRETFPVTITLGKRHHDRLEEMAKPFGMTIEEAAFYILKKQLEKN